MVRLRSVVFDEITEQVAFVSGLGRVETEAADHDNVEQSDCKGCRAADPQNDCVLLEKVFQRFVASDIWFTCAKFSSYR